MTASQRETPLGQGLTLTQFERLYPSGWVNGWLLKVSLAHPAITTDLITAPGVTTGQTLSAMAARAGATAAINGDFFDIGQTGIALGSVVSGGQFLQSRIPEWPNAAGVGQDRIGRLVDVTLEGTVTLPGGSYTLGAINLPTVPSHTLGLYTPMWTIARDRAMYGATDAREVVVQAGRVISVSDKVTNQAIPADGFVLVGREEFAQPLAGLKVGDPVSVSYRPKPDLIWAVGGNRQLVKNGQIAAGLDDKTPMPRTALGFSRDGQQMFMLAVDGRSAKSGGFTLRELAETMLSFGATEVLELDGGGSTTMVARQPGQQTPSVVNQPSDGRERSIPNGVAVFAAPGSGVAQSLEVEGDARLFPGLSRRLQAVGLDEQFAPAPVGTVAWTAEGVGTITPEGLFRATAPGQALVRARAQLEPGAAVQGQLALRVLGPLARIELVGEGLRLSPGQTGSFTVRGYDADGYTASIDPADLTFTYDQNLLRVEAGVDGVQVTARQEGTGLIKATVQGKETWVPFAVTRASGAVESFEQSGGWTFQKYPATVAGSVSTVPGRTGSGLKLTYTFGNEGGTRAAYAQADPSLLLPGKPETVGLWVKGDGKRAWLRAVLVDAKGTSHTINLARHVDWTDWSYVEAEVPPGVAYPLKLHRIYPVETDTTRQYSGELIFDDLSIGIPVDLPAVPAAPAPGVDPIWQASAPASASSWSFALVGRLGLPMGPNPKGVSLAQPGALTANGIAGVSLIGSLPATLAEREAQKLVQQVMAAKPSFLLIDPSITTASEAALWTEAAGTTPIYQITPPARHLDVSGTRFILTGSQGGGLRAAQFDQLLSLKSSLDAARLDATVRQVVVLGQHIPAQFTDQREGNLVADWLTEFEEGSGKPVLYLTAGGAAKSVLRVEGIPYVEAGTPKGAQLFTIDPAPGATWFRTNP